MAFLLNSQAQGVSGKNERSIQTPWRGAPEERGPMQLHRLHRLKAGTAYWSDPGLHHSVNVCFLKKSQLRKVSWRRISLHAKLLMIVSRSVSPRISGSMLRFYCWGLALISQWAQSAKLDLLWRVFAVHLLSFFKPAWCSNLSELSYSLVNI